MRRSEIIDMVETVHASGAAATKSGTMVMLISEAFNHRKFLAEQKTSD